MPCPHCGSARTQTKSKSGASTKRKTKRRAGSRKHPEEILSRRAVTGKPRLVHPARSANPAVGGFDPSLPEDHALIIAGVLRDQFNGLKQLIDNLQSWMNQVIDGYNTTLVDMQQQERADIAGTSRNVANVPPLTFTVSNPPEQWEVQAILDKVNEVLSTASR